MRQSDGFMLTDTQRAELRERLLAGETPTSAASAMRIHHSSACRERDRIKIEAAQGLHGFRPVLPGYEIAGTSTQLGDTGLVEREWIRQRKEPGPTFEAPAGHSIRGVSALVDASGRVIQQWVKTKDETQPEDVMASMMAALAGFEPRAPFIVPPAANDDDLLTVYPLPDAHLGALSWGRETGQNYDLRIAVARMREMASDLIAQSRPSSRAIVLGLGDWMHMNDRTNMTPRSGHILDCDGRYPRVLEAAIRLGMDIIEMAAEKHAEVLVRFIPGNHDPDATAAVMAAFRVFYASNPRITIDDGEGEHFYHRFGKVLIGATHGHSVKPDRMAMMLAADRPEDWGATKFRHMLFGHVHHEQAKEVGGVRVESFNTPASRDAHAHGGGWRSGQSLSALTFHSERGEIGRHRVNLVAA